MLTGSGGALGGVDGSWDTALAAAMQASDLVTAAKAVADGSPCDLRSG